MTVLRSSNATFLAKNASRSKIDDKLRFCRIQEGKHRAPEVLRLMTLYLRLLQTWPLRLSTIIIRCTTQNV